MKDVTLLDYCIVQTGIVAWGILFAYCYSLGW